MTRPEEQKAPAAPGRKVKSPEQLRLIADISAQLPEKVLAQVRSDLNLFTEEQLTVIDRVVNTQRSLVLKSTAGSGKSKLLQVIARILPRQVGKVIACFAFNASISEELKHKLPKDILNSTFHSHGLSLITQFSPRKPVVVPFKRRNLARKYLAMHDLVTEGNIKSLNTLVEKVLIYQCENSVEAVAELVQREDLQFPPELDVLDAIKWVQEAALQNYLEKTEIDYLDMLYLPLKLGYGRGSIHEMLIDEAQDFNRLQHKLVKHLLAPGGRVFFVGDPDQGIYVFTGADAAGMDRAKDIFKAEELFLTVTFRCPKSHVSQLAAQYSDHIRCPDFAKEGSIEHLKPDELNQRLMPGHLVMSRRNAPLIKLALELAGTGKPVNLLGVNIEQDLKKLLTRAFPQPFSEDEVESRLTRMYDLMLEDRFQKAEFGKALQRGAERDADLLACCGAIAMRGCVAGDGKSTLKQLDAILDTLTTKGKDSIKLCTVHKAKGLEAEVVAILNPEELQGDGEQELTAEERAVAFVAFTRSKNTMLLCSEAHTGEDDQGVQGEAA